MSDGFASFRAANLFSGSNDLIIFDVTFDKPLCASKNSLSSSLPGLKSTGLSIYFDFILATCFRCFNKC